MKKTAKFMIASILALCGQGCLGLEFMEYFRTQHQRRNHQRSSHGHAHTGIL